ncbi:hypothetical protein C8J57DRAFT_1220142 [Mycena rebaudengoi]|nr:hypothetical protein C8J57DRAFT_1220142 [Mycena rebaudengoi]
MFPFNLNPNAPSPFQPSLSPMDVVTPVLESCVTTLDNNFNPPSFAPAISQALPPPSLSLPQLCTQYLQLRNNHLQLPRHFSQCLPTPREARRHCHLRLGYHSLPVPLPHPDPYVIPPQFTICDLAHTGFLVAFFSGYWITCLYGMGPLMFGRHFVFASCNWELPLPQGGFCPAIIALVRLHLPTADSETRHQFLHSLLNVSLGVLPNHNLQPDNFWHQIAILPPDWQDPQVPADRQDRVITFDAMATAWADLADHGFTIGTAHDAVMDGYSSAHVMEGKELRRFANSTGTSPSQLYDPAMEEHYTTPPLHPLAQALYLGRAQRPPPRRVTTSADLAWFAAAPRPHAVVLSWSSPDHIVRFKARTISIGQPAMSKMCIPPFFFTRPRAFAAYQDPAL